ncbi:DUF1697 domain-containing protein [Cellulomonas timonensis]|uniref:DUF1697 domain-containing protein n=1 Tax=Cellulomonas timonensis TaxID=1689271 RepID=UPI00082B9882|nr:DUF1697 domain-containing protein [Cellulomonas timonensis]
MTAVTALLRGVNVGGRRKVPMADLRAVIEHLGHRAVATHLNSGNAVFVVDEGTVVNEVTAEGADSLDSAAIATAVSAGLRERLALDVDVVARTAARWDAMVAANPFEDEARADPGHVLVVFYADPVRSPGLDASRYGAERIVWDGAHAYVHYPDGIGRSRLTPDLLDRAAGQPGTGRNWRTVLALQELLRARA